MVKKYKEIASSQKDKKDSIDVYKEQIRPIIKQEQDRECEREKEWNKLMEEVKKCQEHFCPCPQISPELHIKRFVYYLKDIDTELKRRMSKQDFIELFSGYLKLSKEAEEAGYKFGNFTISSDFDLLYNIYHNSYSKEVEHYLLEDTITKENLHKLIRAVNVSQFTKDVLRDKSDTTFTASWILLLSNLKFRKIDEYQGAWSVYYYLLNEKNIKAKKNKEDIEKKEAFFKTAFAYTFYLNTRKSGSSSKR